MTIFNHIAPNYGGRHRLQPAISLDLARALSDVASAALGLPASARLPYSCRRLLGEAAVARPLCRDAARTVINIAADVLADDEVELETTQ